MNTQLPDPDVESSSRKATVNGVEYRWEGGFGSIISSIEKRAAMVGEVRYVGNTLFYAFRVERISWFSQRRKICWSVPNASIEWLNKFHNALFLR